MTREDAIRAARTAIEAAMDEVIATALADESCVTAAHEAYLQLALLEDGVLRALYLAGWEACRAETGRALTQGYPPVQHPKEGE